MDILVTLKEYEGGSNYIKHQGRIHNTNSIHQSFHL
jgi:hypothetical protein